MPPFLALALSLVLRLSARVRSTAAAHQASGLITLPLIMIAYSQSTGALFGATSVTLFIGVVAWLIAMFSLSPRDAQSAPRPPTRRRRRTLAFLYILEARYAVIRVAGHAAQIG